MQASISVQCDKNNLKEIRLFLENKLHETRVSEQEIGLIILAVDEICANIIIHSNQCDKSKFFNLNLHYIPESSTLKISLVDDGDFFNFNAYQGLSLENLIKQQKKGGLGLKLVQKIMDKIEFKKLGEQNLCTMIKKVQMNYFTPSF